MNIKDIAGSDIKPLLKYIEEQTSKDNAYLYRTEFKHIAEMASSHPSITIDEYKKLLADSAKSGRLQTLRRMSYVDKIYPQFGITECFIQYKCSVNTPPPHTIKRG